MVTRSLSGNVYNSSISLFTIPSSGCAKMSAKQVDISPDLSEKNLEQGNRRSGSLSQDAKALGLRTVEAGLEADQVIKDADFDAKERRRILRKIDYRLVPLLGVIYLIAFIDRGNSKFHFSSSTHLTITVGNAKIAGMEEDLNLIGMRYNAALTIFFPPYALLEVPSNIVLKILRPSIWIATLMFCWGLVMTLMGIVHTYEGLLITRFFLGVTESGFFPAATYLLTIWYLRYEVQRRMAVFYAAASLSGAFSGLLAYGISFMDGIGDRAGWQWIFLLEGKSAHPTPMV